MKKLVIGVKEIQICEHQGDINYLRFVKFKQWIPQVFEKMDIPVFAIHHEKFCDLFNQGKYIQSASVWHDYQLAIKQAKENSFDAWGICFALLAVEEGEDPTLCPNDVQLQDKIKKYSALGLTAKTVKEEVLGFMKDSPEEFAEVLIPYVLPSLMNGIEN